MTRSGRNLARAIGLAAGVCLLFPLAASAASGQITDCNDETQLRADVNAGGAFTFACSGTITLTTPLAITNQVSLTAVAPNQVTIRGHNPSQQPAPGINARVFEVQAGGSLSATGLTITNGLVTAPAVSTPNHSQPPGSQCVTIVTGFMAGACGVSAPNATGPGQTGAVGVQAGGNGGNAPPGGAATGGCILILPNGSATLVSDTVSNCVALGSSDRWQPGTGEGAPGFQEGVGGFGGLGGSGGNGGTGGREDVGTGNPICTGTSGDPPSPGGIGGSGTPGGNGGNGSAGGNGLGGAIFDGGSLTVSKTSFVSNGAGGGQGGPGGDGGRGGRGGSGGAGGGLVTKFNCGFVSSAPTNGGSGATGGFPGGNGGNGGNGGAGQGGAIYAQGFLSIIGSSFSSDSASGGGGGTAGLGGAGGNGGQGGDSGGFWMSDNTHTSSGGTGGSGGAGGNAGNTGNGGDGIGGAVFYASGATGSLPAAGATFSSDTVSGGVPCAGLVPVNSINCDTTPGAGGSGGGGGRNTPCSDMAMTMCPFASNGASGLHGVTGAIGISGSGRNNDVSGAPSSGHPPPPAKPTISGAKLTNTRFRVGKSGTAISAKAPLGTTFRFKLSAASKLTLTITHTARGLRRGKRCVAPTSKLKHKHAKRCTRTLTDGTLTRSHEPAGADSLAFSGRIGHRALRPGSYHAVLNASDAAGSSKHVTLRFVVVR